MVVHSSPREHLPGDAAGGRPGWEGRLLSLVDDAEREKADRRGAGMRNWPARIMVACDIDWRVLLRQAATRRGISSAGYIRRATSAFIAADLGLAFSDVVVHTPRPSGPEGIAGIGVSPPGRQRDDGTDHGQWLVYTPTETHQHTPDVCCWCNHRGLYPSQDGWLVCAAHQGM